VSWAMERKSFLGLLIAFDFIWYDQTSGVLMRLEAQHRSETRPRRFYRVS
jgi:hypothetical protein